MGRSSKKRISVAILGCGKIAGFPGFAKGGAGVFTHLPAYRRFADVDVVAACDVDKKQLREFCDFYKIRNSYADLGEMLEKEKVDVLSICTPPEVHYSAIKKAAAEGVKYILCEKPLTLSAKDALGIEKICKRKGISLTVNYLRRYHPDYRDLKRFIKSGKAGEVKKIHCLYTRGLVNNGSHLLDLLLYLFGSVDYVYDAEAVAGSGKYQDISSKLRFKGGFECFVQPMSSLDYSIFEIDIFFEKARVTITDSGRTIITRKAAGSRGFPGFKVLLDHSKKKDCTNMGMVPVVGNVLSDAREKRKRTGQISDSVYVSKLVDAIKKSSRKKGKRVTIYKKGRKYE
ncbi:MAG: Gfo/Idh/MocA family oxidoreductase [Candidatus Omnitrophota bacterium]|jgi:predicted dehydrogenase